MSGTTGMAVSTQITLCLLWAKGQVQGTSWWCQSERWKMTLWPRCSEKTCLNACLFFLWSFADELGGDCKAGCGDSLLPVWTWIFFTVTVHVLFFSQLRGWTCAAWPTWPRFWTTGGSTSWTRWKDSCRTTTSLSCQIMPGRAAGRVGITGTNCFTSPFYTLAAVIIIKSCPTFIWHILPFFLQALT